MSDGLSRRAGEASRRNGGDEIGDSYRSVPEIDDGQLKLAVAGELKD